MKIKMTPSSWKMSFSPQICLYIITFPNTNRPHIMEETHNLKAHQGRQNELRRGWELFVWNGGKHEYIYYTIQS